MQKLEVCKSFPSHAHYLLFDQECESRRTTKLQFNPYLRMTNIWILRLHVSKATWSCQSSVKVCCSPIQIPTAFRHLKRAEIASLR